MPTYDYRCNACKHTFELFQSMSASPKRKCPACGALQLERLIGTGAAVLFKGSGFYQTDYRSDSYKKAAEADSPSGSKKDASASKDSPSTSGKGGADTPKKSPTKSPKADS